MRIGILNAFKPGSDLIKWESTPFDAYVRFLASVGAPLEPVEYALTRGVFPDSVDDCDAYLVTGSLCGVYDPEVWISMLSGFIQVAFLAGKKLVGICFGHQILAHALGGRAERSEKGWGLGLKSIDLAGHQEWMFGRPERLALYFVHQDQVIRLPEGADLLGGDAFCPNALFSIENRVLGIQGHPEFSAGIMRHIFSQLEGSVEAERLQVALQSLDGGTPDNRLVAQWIMNFLEV